MRFVKLVSVLLLSGYLAPSAMAQSAARTESIFPLYLQTSIPIEPGVDPRISRQDAFHSVFEILNPNTSEMRATYQIFDSRGREIPLTINLLIVKGKSAFGLFGGLGSVPNFVFLGWMKVTSTLPVIIQEEISHTEDVISGPDPRQSLKSRILISPASATRHAAVEIRYSSPDPTTGETQNPGIGIVFPSSSLAVAANGTLTLWSAVGEKVAQKQLSIPANGQIADAFTGLFPQFPNSLVGTLELSFDQDVFVTAIQFRSSRLGESMAEPLHGTFDSVSQQASLRELP